MKIYLNKPKEDWIVDRFVDEWNDHNKSFTTRNIFRSNVIWIIAPWTWRKINKVSLKNKKVVCTVHHIDESKFVGDELEKFYEMDQYVDFYHSISENTNIQLKKFTDKKIYNIPFWINPKIWFEIKNKENIKAKYSLSEDKYYVGSFQRDTEGSDLMSPKLSKGPDQFLEIVKSIKEKKPNLEVILSGKRRQYLINKLNEHKIQYSYFEMADFSELNELYNCLDLYIVASRVEGGPQSILEATLTKTPIISTDVGLAKEILHPDSIFNMDNFLDAVPNTNYALEKIQDLLIPGGFNKFIEMFEQVYEN